MPALALFVDVDAPAAATWAAAVDWATQGDWMLGTRVTPTHNNGEGVGGRLEAFSGIGRLGFLDTMEITLWQPPRACHVLHTGRVVRGTGAFEVEPRGDARSRFIWREDLDLPLGRLGQLGWLLVRPLFAYGVQLSLKRFAKQVAATAPRP
ncbi:MAG: SRPBCC family protein [Mycobacteriales bacterium]